MAKDILKEAIADAKAVREVALANAKAALEEAFTPKLQSMLSAKLSEELDEEMYDEDEDMNMGEMMYDEDEDMDEGHVDGHMANTDMGEEDSMDEEIDLEEILNELELEEDDSEEEEEIEEVHRVGQPNYKGDGVHDVLNRASDVNDGLNENFDLDALLKEINDLEDKEDAPVLTAEPPLDEEKDTPEHIKHHRNFELNNRVKLKETKGGCGCKKEITELTKTKKALDTVKGELTEVNLLNSKLLYVNRIFKANNLSEAQKLRVVETLDNASNIKEAKLIYETIKDTFTISSKGKKTAPKKSIRENFGMASKAAGTSTAPKKEVISESNDMVARFKKLANIKINE